MLGRLQRRRCSICSFNEGAFGYYGRQSLSVSMTILQRFMTPRQEKRLGLMLLPAFWHKDAKGVFDVHVKNEMM